MIDPCIRADGRASTLSLAITARRSMKSRSKNPRNVSPRREQLRIAMATNREVAQQIALTTTMKASSGSVLGEVDVD